MEGDSTVDSVSASWNKPVGEVTSYEIACSEGDVMPPSGDQTGDGPFSASCENLLTPGEEYIMSVTSLSNGERSEVATIALRACELKREFFFLHCNNLNNNTNSVFWFCDMSVIHVHVHDTPGA